MLKPNDIISLTDFQRNTQAHIKRIKKSGRPLVLTINGRAALFVDDVTELESYQTAQNTRELIESLEDGIESVKRGGGRPFDDAFAEIYDRLIDASGRARPRRRKAS